MRRGISCIFPFWFQIPSRLTWCRQIKYQLHSRSPQLQNLGLCIREENCIFVWIGRQQAYKVVNSQGKMCNAVTFTSRAQSSIGDRFCLNLVWQWYLEQWSHWQVYYKKTFWPFVCLTVTFQTMAIWQLTKPTKFLLMFGWSIVGDTRAFELRSLPMWMSMLSFVPTWLANCAVLFNWYFASCSLTCSFNIYVTLTSTSWNN